MIIVIIMIIMVIVVTVTMWSATPVQNRRCLIPKGYE